MLLDTHVDNKLLTLCIIILTSVISYCLLVTGLFKVKFLNAFAKLHKDSSSAFVKFRKRIGRL